MPRSLLRRLLWNVVPICAIALAVGYTLVGEDGLLNRHALKQELFATQAKVAEIETENEILRSRIRRLREDPDAVRRLAAERMLLAAPGSTIYRFPDEISTAGTSTAGTSTAGTSAPPAPAPAPAPAAPEGALEGEP